MENFQMGLFDDAEFQDNSERKHKEWPVEKFEQGTYMAEVMDFSIDQKKDRISWYLKLKKAGEFSGMYVFRSYKIDPKGLGYLHEDLTRLKLETNLEDLEELAEQMNKMINVDLEVWCKPNEYQGKIYVNPYINGYYDESDAPSIDEESPSFDKDEEIPF